MGSLAKGWVQVLIYYSFPSKLPQAEELKTTGIVCLILMSLTIGIDRDVESVGSSAPVTNCPQLVH